MTEKEPEFIVPELMLVLPLELQGELKSD